MNEIEYEEMQESAAIGQMIAENLKFILDAYDVKTVEDLYCVVYKYTDCGPWISVKLHNGTWRHCHELNGIDNNDVCALLVGSIVEGSDAEVCADPINLIDYIDEDGAVKSLAAFNQSVEWVNDEAARIWDESNIERIEL